MEMGGNVDGSEFHERYMLDRLNLTVRQRDGLIASLLGVIMEQFEGWKS